MIGWEEEIWGLAIGKMNGEVEGRGRVRAREPCLDKVRSPWSGKEDDSLVQAIIYECMHFVLAKTST